VGDNFARVKSFKIRCHSAALHEVVLAAIGSDN